MRPEEVRRLAEDRVIMFVPESYPINTFKVTYYQDRYLRKLYEGQSGAYPEPPAAQRPERSGGVGPLLIAGPDGGGGAGEVDPEPDPEPTVTPTADAPPASATSQSRDDAMSKADVGDRKPPATPSAPPASGDLPSEPAQGESPDGGDAASSPGPRQPTEHEKHAEASLRRIDVKSEKLIIRLAQARSRLDSGSRRSA